MYYAANGMNLSKSIKNPTSRFRRVMDYLNTNGPRTKRQILFDVFGKEVRPLVLNHQTQLFDRRPPKYVSMGWASYMFTLAVKYGYVRTIRRNHTTYWTTAHIITENK